MVNIDKVRFLANMKGLKLSKLCEEAGVGVTYLANVAKGKHDMPMFRVEHFAKILNTTTDYLMDKTDDPTAPDRKGRKIRRFGEVAAGFPMEQIVDFSEDDPDDWEEISSDLPGEYFCLTIKGDSMNPVMLTGDKIIVHIQETAENGDICVVGIQRDTATVKRIKVDERGLMLIPANPSYEPMFYSNEEVQTLPVTILGKVVEIRRSV